MSRRTLALFALTAALMMAATIPAPVFAHGKKGIEGSGDMETRSLDLDTFDRIEIGGAFELEATMGDKQSVAMTIDDNLWENLVVEVKGSTLKVGWKKDCSPDGDCRLVVTVRALKSLDIHGASEVTISDFRGEAFDFDVSGAADLEMGGQVDDLKISVSGAGNIDTRQLQAKNVEISVSGAGSADIYAAESLDGRVSGVGNITYWGDPQDIQTEVSGMGSIKGK